MKDNNVIRGTLALAEKYHIVCGLQGFNECFDERDVAKTENQVPFLLM